MPDIFMQNKAARGNGQQFLPFYFTGWVECAADTACDCSLLDFLLYLKYNDYSIYPSHSWRIINNEPGKAADLPMRTD